MRDQTEEKLLWIAILKVKMIKHPMRWVFWALAAFFYFYEYFLRVQPSVIIPELMSAFSVDATAIGSLSAFYFYIYGPMQLPVGIMTDRYGARRLLALAAATAGFGTLIFAVSPYYWLASLGRFFMGAGSSFGFVGMLYITSHWFAEKRRGLLIGLGGAIGALGAVFGEGPLREAVNAFGWRFVSLILAGIGFLLALIIALAVRNAPEEMIAYDEKVKKEPPHILKNLMIVCANPYTWVIALSSLFIYIFTPGFGGLWGISFVHSTHGYSIEDAGFAVSMVFVGWAVGSPVIGKLSDYLRAKKLLIIIGGLLGALLIAAVIYIPNWPLWTLYILFFLLGFVSATQLLAYSYAIDINPGPTKGTAAAFINFMTVVGAALIQPLIGFFLDRYWTGEMSKGIRVYSPSDFKIAMTCFPIFFLLSSLFAIFLKKFEELKVP